MSIPCIETLEFSAYFSVSSLDNISITFVIFLWGIVVSPRSEFLMEGFIVITAASIIRMDAIEGPKIEYSWTSTRESKSLFSQRGLIQLFTITAMNPSNTPRMIQFSGSLCLISLSNDSPEEKTLLTVLLNKDETPEAQFLLWKKLRTLHGRLKTIEKLVPALERLVSKQNSN